MKSMVNAWIAATAIGALLLPASPAVAQAYPNKPVRLVLPYPPGGGADTLARPMVRRISESLGQQMIVDNRGGANGNVGMEHVSRAAPDGYTVVMGLTAQLAVNPALYAKLPYDPVRDFEPVTLLGEGAYLLVSHPSLPVATVKDVIDLAKRRPGQLLYASSGNGSGGHLANELLNVMTGIQVVHVPYKGGGPAMVDTIAGQTQLLFTPPISSASHIAAGRLRAIGVSTTKRVSSLPQVPTIAESGVPGYDSGVWYGILVPRGTPAPVIARLNQEFRNALADASIRELMAKSGIDANGSSPEELGRYIRSELLKWAKVVKAANLKLD